MGPLYNVCIENPSFSDHKPIVFMIPVVSSITVNKSVGCYSRFINSLTASQFSEKYLANAIEGLILNAESSIGPDDLICLFYPSCSDILDSIAPFKIKQPKQKSYYWLDNNTRCLRQAEKEMEA